MIFFENWYDFLRIFISCLVAYSILIVWLRISGKRTLSKWNSFDFVVTIALGSVLATTILSKNTVVLEGVFALGLLIGFQFIITWFSVRVEWIADLIKAKPTILYNKDGFLFGEMKKQRVAKGEILSAIRASSIGSLENVEAVVLETDGSFSVIKKTENGGSNSALEGIKGAD